MNLDQIDKLLDAYLLEDLSPEQAAQLRESLQTDSAVRQRFVQSIFSEAHLHPQSRGETDASVPDAEHPPQAGPRGHMAPFAQRLRRLALAAIVLLALGTVAVFYFTRQSPDTYARVSSGNVLVNGQSLDRIPNGAAVTVPGPALAVIQLSDGSRATLEPATQITLRGRVGSVRQVLLLNAGGGEFLVPHGGGQFRIDTPAGSVTVLGTKFTVQLRSRALVVSVASGIVQFDRQGQESATLTAGQGRQFGAATDRIILRPATSRPVPHMAGTIQSVDLGARAIVLATEEGQRTYAFAQDIRVTIHGEPGAIAELTPGMNATLTLTAEQNEVIEIQVHLEAGNREPMQRK